MKNFFWTLMFSCFTIAQAVAISPDSIVDDRSNPVTKSDVSKMKVDQIKGNFTNNIWNQRKASGENTIYEFTEYGMLYIIETTEDGEMNYKEQRWTIEDNEGEKFLVIVDGMSGNEEKYVIERSESTGFTLKSLVTGMKISFMA